MTRNHHHVSASSSNRSERNTNSELEAAYAAEMDEQSLTVTNIVLVCLAQLKEAGKNVELLILLDPSESKTEKRFLIGDTVDRIKSR